MESRVLSLEYVLDGGHVYLCDTFTAANVAEHVSQLQKYKVQVM